MHDLEPMHVAGPSSPVAVAQPRCHQDCVGLFRLISVDLIATMLAMSYSVGCCTHFCCHLRRQRAAVTWPVALCTAKAGVQKSRKVTAIREPRLRWLHVWGAERARCCFWTAMCHIGPGPLGQWSTQHFVEGWPYLSNRLLRHNVFASLAVCGALSLLYMSRAWGDADCLQASVLFVAGVLSTAAFAWYGSCTLSLLKVLDWWPLGAHPVQCLSVMLVGVTAALLCTPDKFPNSGQRFHAVNPCDCKP